MSQYDAFGQPIAEPKSKHPWGETLVSVAAIVIAIVGAKVESLNWIIFICIPILLIAFCLMIAHSEIGTWISDKWAARSDRKILAKAEKEYSELFNDSAIADQLIEKVQRLQWNNNMPPTYIHPGNSYRVMQEILNNTNAKADTKLIIMNFCLRQFIEYVDGYLVACDRFVVDRIVNYKYESERVEMIKLVRKYDDFREEHDKFCKRLNKQLSATTLSLLYGHTISFEPKELNPAV